LRHIPVVVISGAPNAQDSISVSASVTFVAKPVSPPALMRLIAETLRLVPLPTAAAAQEGAVAAIDQVDTEPHVALSSEPVAQRSP
jgi:hypothetical protein